MNTARFGPRAPTQFLSLILLATLLVAGCASNRGTSDFMKTVNGIEPGTPLERVRDKLGGPNVKREGVAPLRPAPPPGAPRGILVTVPSGVRYREWIYHRGDSHYHVFFIPSVARSGKWEVLGVRSAPASKIY